VERPVIIGLGPVSPLGIGKEAFWQKVASGESALKAGDRFSTEERVYGEISPEGLAAHIQDKRLRRAADISKYALAAVGLAGKDADLVLPPDERTAAVVGMTHGALSYTEEFHATLAGEGGGAVSPALFQDSLLNAPAGNLSICFGLKGPVHTLTGGPTVAIKALLLAGRLLEDGRTKEVFVAAAEELNELSFSCYSRPGFVSSSFPLSEGAGALVIARGAEGAEPYCCVSGAASMFRPSLPAEVLAGTMQKALRQAGLELKDIGLVLTDRPLPGIPVPAASLLPLAGNAFCVTTLWHLILAAQILRQRELPASFAGGAKSPGSDIKHVMICSAEDRGAAAVAIMSRPERT
jgi:3-oxoacyl-[acyl-carrier-protein] synthase II